MFMNPPPCKSGRGQTINASSKLIAALPCTLGVELAGTITTSTCSQRLATRVAD